MKTLLALGILALAGCAAARVPEPTMETVGGSAALLADLRAGRELYISKCSGCHALYSVDELSDAAWRDSVAKMIRLKKVTLAPDERHRLEQYLTTMNGRE